MSERGKCNRTYVVVITQNSTNLTAKMTQTCDGMPSVLNLTGQATAANAPANIILMDRFPDYFSGLYDGTANSCDRITGMYEIEEPGDNGTFTWTK